ncbi:hypothetical protein ACFOLC_13680 [Lysobacter cavernae]|uniref:Uncharacterized protein n=1 Tax=Lysobacter cavernae TaxID=1685901 RepID=A0ABV7RT27_9GAMM
MNRSPVIDRSGYGFGAWADIPAINAGAGIGYRGRSLRRHP